MGAWDSWIGREERREDWSDPALLTRWLATFDRAGTADGTAPQGFHWCLCTPDAPTAALAEDGHPRRDDSPGSFLPPVPLPRRMWASSKVEFLAPIRPDVAASRTSWVRSVTEKQGGSGTLVFIDIEHETSSAGALAVREVQSLVYRAAAASDAPLSPPEPGEARFDPAGWDAHLSLVPSEALLFRYSALTFNSHRIHYDLPYACEVERYRGLVVHGPLIATLFLKLAQRELGDNALTSFAFRGLSPAICGEELHFAMRRMGEAWELGAFAGDGRQVSSASASSRA